MATNFTRDCEEHLQMKDSFVFYLSQYDAIKELNNEQLGRLMRAIFEKQLGNEVVLENDIKIAFNFINNQMLVDQKKYDEICEKRRASGKRGGAPKGNSNASKTTKTTKTSKNKQNKLNDNDNDSSYEEEKKIKKENDFSFIATEIIDFLNIQSGCSYKANTKATQEHIRARLREGYTVDDFKKVIASKVTEWGNNPKMRPYIRPNTLFAGKFESYLQEALQSEKQTSCLEIQGFT